MHTCGSTVPAGAFRVWWHCRLNCAPAVLAKNKQNSHNPAAFCVIPPGLRQSSRQPAQEPAWLGRSRRTYPGLALLPFPLHGPQATSLIFLINGCIPHEHSSGSAVSVHARLQDRGFSATGAGKGMGKADAAPYLGSAPFLKVTSSGFGGGCFVFTY